MEALTASVARWSKKDEILVHVLIPLLLRDLYSIDIELPSDLKARIGAFVSDLSRGR